MARVCDLTGKKRMVGNNVSHSLNRTKRTFDTNLIKKRFYIPEDDKWITLKITASALKTINKIGIKAAIKDAKLRTFITDDVNRDELVKHVYDITYGSIKKTDNLVIVDDSIVRGTTLQKSILKMLNRLSPKKIVVVSSAPQIRYPDCYGIDMAIMDDLIAFRAAIRLFKKKFRASSLEDIYKKCKKENKKVPTKIKNIVKEIYNPFTDNQISKEISRMLKDDDITADVDVVFQSIENLHKACPNHLGDWYFSGDYPTPGGNKIVNKAFINYYEGLKIRAY